MAVSAVASLSQKLVSRSQHCSTVPQSDFLFNSRSLSKANFKPISRRNKLVLVSSSAAFKLRDLPYELDALEPYMSKETLEYHWGKHHRTYVEKLNTQIADSELEKLSLEELVKASYNGGEPLPCFNNAAQVWNHDFFWDSLRAGEEKLPEGEILDLINRDFGSYDNFVNEFSQKSLNQFGSGWAWLVASPKTGKLSIESSSNALNPLLWGNIPLLTLDVWEHAYYIDYRNRRVDFISVFLKNMVNWSTVQSRLDAAKALITV